jgi:hypothetical protein
MAIDYVIGRRACGILRTSATISFMVVKAYVIFISYYAKHNFFFFPDEILPILKIVEFFSIWLYKRADIFTPSSDISTPFDTKISLFGVEISLAVYNYKNKVLTIDVMACHKMYNYVFKPLRKSWHPNPTRLQRRQKKLHNLPNRC